MRMCMRMCICMCMCKSMSMRLCMCMCMWTTGLTRGKPARNPGPANPPTLLITGVSLAQLAGERSYLNPLLKK